ncbi:MAG: hypothetical protein BGO89_08425 [Candidatus Kapaibacterium thiocyanatum]|uniref:Uncharacterized protein n=1 Tax=Candidatus Kapaibacterium thiocyanatum TaxID=1895771 RepID=A0A1M3L3V7_9BACT|nr:MAG: hypothetical protein BGO89_08425 ['Candidatus Kapabacteria' thiocyanatum]
MEYSLVSALKKISIDWYGSDHIYEHPIQNRDQYIYFKETNTIQEYAHEFIANCAEHTNAAPVHDLKTKEKTHTISPEEAAFPHSYFQVRHKQNSTKALLCALKIGRVSHREVFWKCLSETFKHLYPGYVLSYAAVLNADVAKQYVENGALNEIEIIGHHLPASVEKVMQPYLQGVSKDYSYKLKVIPHSVEKRFKNAANQRVSKFFDGGMSPSEIFSFTDPYHDVSVEVVIGGRKKRIVVSKAGFKGIDMLIETTDYDHETGLPAISELRNACNDIADEYFR